MQAPELHGGGLVDATNRPTGGVPRARPRGSETHPETPTPSKAILWHTPEDKTDDRETVLVRGGAKRKLDFQGGRGRERCWVEATLATTTARIVKNPRKLTAQEQPTRTPLADISNCFQVPSGGVEQALQSQRQGLEAMFTELCTRLEAELHS
jgi:hypothetical protein